MKLVAATLLLAAVAACGHAQQQRRDPEYGLGSPWPEASIDSAQSTIRNEFVLSFAKDVSDDRALFLVDSIARDLRAAVRRTRTSTDTSFTFRWPPNLPTDRDSVMAALKSRPEVARIRPGILVSGAGGTN